MTDLETPPPLVRARSLSERVRAVPPSGIRKFFDVIATMPDVISLGVGEPDFDTPPQVVEEGVAHLRRGGRTTPATTARSSCAARWRRTWSGSTASVQPRNEICVTVGASEAVAARCRRSRDPGDEVLLHEPSYVAYLPAILFNGGTPVMVVHDRREWLRARARAARGGDHAAHQGPVHGLSVQSDRRRA